MSTRLSLIVPEPDSAGWDGLSAVLAGKHRPVLDAEAVKLINVISSSPCDVRLRPGRFERWRTSRGVHHEYRAQTAPAVVHQLMRRLGLRRLEQPCVGLLFRLGLGSRFPERGAKAIWMVPAEEQLEILVREAPNEMGPRAAIEVPASGPWALPAPCARPEASWIEAQRSCPYCRARPAMYRELQTQFALVCPECGRSFDRRY